MSSSAESGMPSSSEYQRKVAAEAAKAKARQRARAAMAKKDEDEDEQGQGQGQGQEDIPCQMLKNDAVLSFTQETAPSSNNLLLLRVANLINQHLEGVVNVDISLRGDSMHATVGSFEVKATISRLTSNGVATECYSIPYEILDIDECSYPKSHPLSANCASGTKCVNTLGSYECACPDGLWGVQGSGSGEGGVGLLKSLFSSSKLPEGACGGEKNTSHCCLHVQSNSDPKTFSRNCRGNFRCTSDACEGIGCGPHSSCVPGQAYHKFECACHKGYKMVDTVCERDIPVVDDVCAGNTCPTNCRCERSQSGATYNCVAKVGYTKYSDPTAPLPPDAAPDGPRLDRTTACLSGSVPKIYLNGPNPLRLKQGDIYEELGVNVEDENESDDERTVKIQYSHPFGPYFKSTGDYYVIYSIETPWLHLNNSNIIERREVIVSDVDECTYTGSVESFIHQCVSEATCMNLDGSYECKCPPGYSGDGLKNGSGCADNLPPQLSCIGEACRPMKYSACNCIGLVAADGTQHMLTDELTEGFVENFLEKMSNTMCRQGCFMAVDETYGGLVNLTESIRRGSIERDPEREQVWRIPFDVMDEAGNAAPTQYYIIEVDAIDVLGSVRHSIVGTGGILSARRASSVAMAVPSLLLTLVVIATLLGWLAFWLRSITQAIKFAIDPQSLVDSKEDFDLGYDLLLRLQWMGMLTQRERQRKTAVAWAKLQDAANKDDESNGDEDEDGEDYKEDGDD